MTLAAHLKLKALELGFDLVGICPAVPSAHAEFYAQWVEAGCAGEMGYLARRIRERSDPRLVWHDCRTIVVVGLNSFVRDEGMGVPGHGVIARYARRDDYHNVIKWRLMALLEWLSGETGRSPASLGRAYVDTGPLLERELAMRAGLGWIGKNTCLISHHFGSWLLLGELLLEIELPPDKPWATPHCGTCTRCLEACPTGALVEPHLLDARRCLAYLSIELRGAIPEALRPLLGHRIFGCDICQDVCPWNQRFSQASSHPAFQPRSDLANPSLLELMTLKDEQFQRRFQGTPVMRAKRRGLLRNVLVALGNWANPAAQQTLVTALNNPDPLLREHAVWALDRIRCD